MSNIVRLGVVGAGIMGQGIAASNLKTEIHVALTDAAEEQLSAEYAEGDDGTWGVVLPKSFCELLAGIPAAERADGMAHDAK